MITKIPLQVPKMVSGGVAGCLSAANMRLISSFSARQVELANVVRDKPTHRTDYGGGVAYA